MEAHHQVQGRAPDLVQGHLIKPRSQQLQPQPGMSSTINSFQ